MKKFLWLLSVVAILGLINCGGSSGSNSKEEKKLLTKTLNLVGIPQSIVVNISFDGGNSQYSAAAASSRSFLETTFNWTISDGGQI